MRLTRKELKFTVGLTTNFDAYMQNVVGTYLCPHRHCAYMWACQRVLPVLLFISPLLLLVCLSVRLMIVYHCARRFIFRPSICLIFRPSICMSVCMYVHMYLCRDERTSVCTVDIEN